MNPPPFDQIVVDPVVAETPFVRQFLSRCPAHIPVAASPVKPHGRRAVFVTREPGAFLKPCPCSPGAVRCGYWVLSPMFQCPFHCTYCFLRFYAPEEPLTLYANLDEARDQFLAQLAQWPGPVRLGTGEFADSLALDPWTRHSAWLLDLVAPHPRVSLELKTKSAEVAALLARPALPNVVIAWSLNPPSRVSRDEAGTAPLEGRLEAAAAVVAAGYRVAFHFDPVVLAAGWEEEYSDLVGRLAQAVRADRVAWVSVGTLRFPPHFLERWGRTLAGRAEYFDELLPGSDGKLRTFWPLRRHAYRVLEGELRRWGGARLPVYLCMESPEMWHSALGYAPAEGEVADRLTAKG